MPLNITPWMRDELARRKQLYRDLFAGRPLERVPVDVRVTVPSPVPATVQEQFRDGDKQLAAAMANALATWEHAPLSDGIPAMRPDVGCSCLASAFGVEYFWGDNPNQTPRGEPDTVSADSWRHFRALMGGVKLEASHG